ncbi:MAG: hypothetical protein RIR91_1133 [Verrucomicrobiota bacterium]
MNILVLALLAAATNTQPANTNGTTSKNTPSKVSAKSKTAKPAAQTDVAGNPVPATDGATAEGATPPPPKKKKGEEAAAPDAGSPAALVGNSVDAATQIANEAAKAAMEEIKRLQAIGGDSAAPGPGAGKLVEAGVAGTAAVAKEAGKAQKKKPTEETSTEQEPAAKPEKKKKPAPTEEGAKDGKVFGVKVEGAPQKQ